MWYYKQIISKKHKKDTWTKPKRGRIKGGNWGWLGSGGSGWGETETTVLEQR